jgi:hypothetical protein
MTEPASGPIAVPYWNGEHPRPAFLASDTWIAHRDELCGYATGMCEGHELHARITNMRNAERLAARVEADRAATASER